MKGRDFDVESKKWIIGGITAVGALIGGGYTAYQIAQEAINSIVEAEVKEHIDYVYEELSVLKLSVDNEKFRIDTLKSNIDSISNSTRDIERSWSQKVQRIEILIETTREHANNSLGRIGGDIGGLRNTDQSLDRRLAVQEWVEQKRLQEEALRRQPISPEQEAQILKKYGIQQSN